MPRNDRVGHQMAGAVTVPESCGPGVSRGSRQESGYGTPCSVRESRSRHHSAWQVRQNISRPGYSSLCLPRKRLSGRSLRHRVQVNVSVIATIVAEATDGATPRWRAMPEAHVDRDIYGSAS